MNRGENISKRTPRNRMRTGKRILIIFAIALVCAAVIIGALFVSGIKLIREEAADGGEIKFFGMTAGGEPYKGTVYYPGGLTAKLDKKNNTLTYSDGSVYKGASVWQ